MNDPFDLEVVADKIIETLHVSAGQVIWIWASTYSLDLIEALAFRIRERGAFWTLRLTMESLLQRIGQEVPETYLGMAPTHEIRWLEDINAIVEVRDHGGHLSGVPLPRRRALAAEWIALIDAANRRGIRRLQVVNPTPALADAYNIPLTQLRRMYWQAINVDYIALDRLQTQAAARLEGVKQVRITSPLVTDLRLNVAGRPVFQDRDSLPRGEVYLAPHEDSAEGVAVIDRLFLRGQPVERLFLTFRGGRVVKMDAPNPEAVEAFRALMDNSTGDKDVIAEFAIGLNPGVAEPVGDVALDEKIGGSVHIALGMNEAFGGKNRSNLHLDMVMLHPTVWFDDEVVLVDGRPVGKGT